MERVALCLLTVTNTFLKPFYIKTNTFMEKQTLSWKGVAL